MNLQKRNLAPIAEETWDELESTVKSVLTTNLTARRVVDTDGPRGWQYSAVSSGRIQEPSGQEKSPVSFGVRIVRPLVEYRVPFSLEREELEAIDRGAEDPDLAPLEKAAIDAARFEDTAVFEGLELGSIEGLSQSAEHTIKKGDSYLRAAAQSVNMLQADGIEGPYALVLPDADWQEFVQQVSGYPPEKRLSDITGGGVIPCRKITDGYIISLRGGDFVLTLGQDFSLRYVHHDLGSVNFEIFGTFSFDIYEPRGFTKITA